MDKWYDIPYSTTKISLISSKIGYYEGQIIYSLITSMASFLCLFMEK